MKASPSPFPIFSPISRHSLNSHILKFNYASISSSSCKAAAVIPSPPPTFSFKNEILDISTAAIAETHPQLLDLAKNGTLILLKKSQYGAVPPWRSEFVEPEAIWIIGTNHISQESASDVERVIKSVRPDNVVVELCRSRQVLGILLRIHVSFGFLFYYFILSLCYSCFKVEYAVMFSRFTHPLDIAVELPNEYVSSDNDSILHLGFSSKLDTRKSLLKYLIDMLTSENSSISLFHFSYSARCFILLEC